jgi:1,5-anhydro-D-fructose reductase (1,5-anhydro-D-mannitol-forming)
VTVGFALVGLGNIAERVASSLENATGARVVAVRSRDVDKARSFAARHGVPKAYSELEQVLADPAVDAVYLATPNSLHAEQALAALAAGKHVLVEKPMALRADDARAMVAAAAQRSLVLGVGFHLRFHPVHIEIRRMIAEGCIGTPTYAEGLFGSVADIQPGQWQLEPALAGHGSLAGLGVHLMDLLPWLLGDRIAEVAAISDGPAEGRPVEMLTTAVVRFAGGAQGVLTSSRRLPNARNGVRIYGTEGLLEGEGTVAVVPAGVLRETDSGETRVHDVPLDDHYRLELESFARAVASGEPFGAAGEDCVASVAVTSAIAEAAASGRTVKVARDA